MPSEFVKPGICKHTAEKLENFDYTKLVTYAVKTT